MDSMIERINALAERESIKLTRVEELIGASQGILTKALRNKTDFKSVWVERICEKFPNWSAEWILRGTGDMYLSDHVLDSSVDLANTSVPTRPHIDDVAAIAGYRGGVADGVTWHSVIYKPVIVGLPDYDLTMRVSGDSMYPYLCSGDLIALREVRSGYFKPGEVYVVSTDEDAFVKRVFSSDREGMAIRCESVNPSYPPFDLPGDSVIKMYRVVGMQRVF